MFDPHLLAELKRNSRRSAFRPALCLLAFLIAGVIAVYTETDPNDHDGWAIIVISGFILIGYVWAISRDGFLVFIENRADEIESFTLGQFADRPMISLRTKEGRSYSLMPNRKQMDEVWSQLKVAFPKKRFY